MEHPLFEEFWQRDLEESVRQVNAKPFVEEAVLQVSNWGFSPADLKVQRKRPGKGILHWIKSLYGQTEDILSGFLGQIHVWQVGSSLLSYLYIFFRWGLSSSSL